MILGRDLLDRIGIDILFSERQIKWGHVTAPMKAVGDDINTHFYIEDTTGIDDPTERLAKITDAKYSPADLNEIVSDLNHLNASEREQLRELLDKCEKLFDGTVGTWKGEPYHIQLKEGATPYHSKPHTIPKAYEDVLRKEVE